MAKLIFRFIVIFLILALIAVAVVSWYASGLALTPRPYSLLPEFNVLAVEGFKGAPSGTVTLSLGNTDNEYADPSSLGNYNLLYEGGYGPLGAIVSQEPDRVTRQLRLAKGVAPQVGQEARVDTFYYRENPKEDLGANYQDLELAGEVGAIKAWWLPNAPDEKVDTGAATAVPVEELSPNPSKTAIMMLHGRRRAALPEMLRMMPAMLELGYPILAMSYRNHSGSVETGRYGYGSSEWRDAALGLQFLQEKGIEKVVIFATSMGGSVAMELLEHNPQPSPQVVGLIFDSPLVQAREVLRFGGIRMGLPAFISPVLLWTVAQRGGLDWQELDHIASIANYNIPLLLIAGADDQTVPITLLDAFAQRAQEGGSLVGYYRLEDAGHVAIWNANPQEYSRWLQEFLRNYAPIAAHSDAATGEAEAVPASQP